MADTITDTKAYRNGLRPETTTNYKLRSGLIHEPKSGLVDGSLILVLNLQFTKRSRLGVSTREAKRAKFCH